MVRALDAVVATLDDHPYLGERSQRELRAELSRADPSADPRQRAVRLLRLGKLEMRTGHERASVAALEEAVELTVRHAGEIPAEARPHLRYLLGLAWMRLGEVENCCARRTPESCILPLSGGAIHTDREGSESAMACFRQVMEDPAAPDLLRHGAQWLMNLAAMTLGEHPDGVPPAYVIPPEAFASDESFPRFANVAKRLGLDTFGYSGGAVAEDFDGDGDLDLAVSDWHPARQMRLWRNDDGAFTDVTEASGIVGIRGGLNMVPADYDNDGDVDLLVLRGAWLGKHGRHPNSLLRNDGRGRFEDVTFDAGLADVHYPTQAAGWADYDNDGDLDLYIGNESTTELTSPSQLFRNEGDGTFRDVAREAGVLNDGYTKGVGWGDYDGDRWPDLYVSNYGDPNRLYRNRGDGTFENVAPRLGVAGPVASFPTWFWDYDNDGNLDLFVGAFAACIADLAVSYLNKPLHVEMARLYRGDGKGGFEDMALRSGLVHPTLPMGANFGDIDGDGWLDFYLGTGAPELESLMPNILYRNRGGTFADVTTDSGLGHLQKGHAVVFADLDNDGDQDVFEEMGGAYLGDPFADALYENPGFGTRWIAVELRGKRSNRRGVGARIRIDVREGTGTRSIHRTMNSGGSFGGNPLRLNIGLGRADRIERLEVWWPTTDVRQEFRDVPMDRWVVVTEGEPALDVRTLKPLRLHPPG